MSRSYNTVKVTTVTSLAAAISESTSLSETDSVQDYTVSLAQANTRETYIPSRVIILYVPARVSQIQGLAQQHTTSLVIAITIHKLSIAINLQTPKDILRPTPSASHSKHPRQPTKESGHTPAGDDYPRYESSLPSPRSQHHPAHSHHH